MGSRRPLTRDDCLETEGRRGLGSKRGPAAASNLETAVLERQSLTLPQAQQQGARSGTNLKPLHGRGESTPTQAKAGPATAPILRRLPEGADVTSPRANDGARSDANVCCSASVVCGSSAGLPPPSAGTPIGWWRLEELLMQVALAEFHSNCPYNLGRRGG